MPDTHDVQKLKFFIHDLRVDKFFLQLIKIHDGLLKAYAKHGLTDSETRHRNYLERFKLRREWAYDARTTYEITVKSKGGEAKILETGRVYIDKTLEACRLALLPHWRRFDAFLHGLPKEAISGVRQLETEFHEIKTWIGAIDRRITNFVRYSDQSPPLEPVDVEELLRDYVEQTLRSYVRTASRHRLELRLGTTAPGMLYASPTMLRRLLFNLVMNAVDAMRTRDTGLIRVDVESEELLIRIKVTDQGVGMSPVKVEQILHTVSDLSGELHSLGFRFVRQTVEAFHGKIYVESTVGEGTTIMLCFPRYVVERDEEPVQPTFEDEKAAQEVHASPGGAASVPGAERAGAIIIDDFCRSLAPLPGCLFSITVTSDGTVDHFAHKTYDPDWMMGHEDLAPMFYRAVFRGRYETDDRCGTALTLKSPHSLEDYWEFRDAGEAIRSAKNGCREIHNEYVRVARQLVETGMDENTMVYITNADEFFAPYQQLFRGDPFPLRELAQQPLVEG